nr:uncharacterized mitochondrial protein AtMg00810-like [Tanacetum cinerariifolium]
METSKPLLKDENGQEVDVHMYRSMIGSLMYLTSLRTDIMFVVCACARHQVSPKVSYLHAVKSIFRYLKRQPKLGLWYPKDSPFELKAYTDNDYAGFSLDRKSTTGGCQFLGCRLISWQCKKQTVVANSITEAEYVAASSCCGQMEAQLEITQNISSLKLHMLKTGDYDLWSIRMEQYLTHTDYALWEVIINGDSPDPEPPAVGTVVPPKTEAQKLARKNELKAKSTLLLAIPDEHLLKFHSIKDAKSLWEAIKTRFEGNKESKKMHKTILRQQYKNFVASRSEGLDKIYDRFQKLISQLELNGEVISQEDASMKLLKSLPLAWQSSSSSNSHNVAFVSSKNTSSINETVNAAQDIPAADCRHSCEQDCTSEFDEFAESKEWAISAKSVGNEIRIDSSTQAVNAASSSINTVSNIIDAGSLNINTTDSNHTNMPTLDAIGIYDGAFDDRDLGAEADTNNLDSSTVDSDFPDKVYKVKKARYGLHQAPRAWYETLPTYLLNNGFKKRQIKKTLFIKRNKGDILLVQGYVDDIIFGSTKKEMCDAFEILMHEKF